MKYLGDAYRLVIFLSSGSLFLYRGVTYANFSSSGKTTFKIAEFIQSVRRTHITRSSQNHQTVYPIFTLNISFSTFFPSEIIE